jgi:ABC-type taurine transport system ATPase subunit
MKPVAFAQVSYAQRVEAQTLPEALDLAKAKHIKYFIWNHKVYEAQDGMVTAQSTTLIERDGKIVDEYENNYKKSEMTLMENGRKTVAGY